MPSVSQSVQINSTNETTLLDKKATIAQGNIIKERDGLLSISGKQDVLIDSLRKESDGYRNEADTLRFANFKLQEGINLKSTELRLTKENFSIKEDIFKADLKDANKKKWGFGFKGFLLGSLATLGAILAFVGL